MKVGEANLAQEDYTVTNETGKLTITFKNEIKDKITVTYNTTYNKTTDQNNHYKNNVKVLGSGNNEEFLSENSATFEVSDAVKNNGSKTGNFDPSTKKYNWILNINENANKLTNTLVTDTLPQGHELDKLVITQEDNSTTLKEGEDYTVTSDEQDSNDPNSIKMVIKFNNELNVKTTLKYTTIDTDGFLNAESKNTAQVTAKEIESANEFTATVENKGSSNEGMGEAFVTKNGVNTGRELNWSLEINRSLSTLNNLVLTDIPKENAGASLTKQKLKEDSFKLYKAEVITTNGEIKFSYENPIALVPGETNSDCDCQLEIQKDELNNYEQFVITFNKPVDTAYKLTYDATYMGSLLENPTNYAFLAYENMDSASQKTDSNKSIVFQFSWAGGGAGVPTKNIIIDKKDENGHAVKGAEFILKDFSGQPVEGFEKITTDENGKATFKDVPLDYYIVEETKTAPGYNFGNERDKKVDLTNNKDQTISFKNIKIQSCIQPITLDNQTGIPVNTLEIYKKDSEGNFKALKDNNDTQVVATIDNGIVKLPNLDLGEYKLDLTAEDKEKLSLTTQNLIFTVDEQGSENCIKEELKLKVEECPSFDITVIGKDNAALPESFVTNSEFKLTDETGETIEVTEDGTTVSLSELTVTKDGKIQKDGQDIKDFLTPGNYTLVQTKTAIGYKPIVESIVDIEGECKGNVTIEVIPTLGEDAACTNFHILAVGSNGVAITDPSNEAYKEYVKNSTFKITTADGTLKFDKVTIDLTTGKLLSNGKEIGKDDIAIGETLKLTQSKTPIGFKSIGTVEITGSDDCFAIVPVVSSELDPGACTTFEISAKDQKGNLIEATSEYAKKSVFKLVSEGTDILTDVTIGVDGKLLKADKTVISKADLTKGAYTLVQTKTPAGYVPVTAEIVTDGNKDCGAVVTINFNKTTDSTPGISCPDFTVSYQGPANSTAAFTLTGEGYSKEITVATDATGKAVYTFGEALEPGQYTLKQTSTPSGYRTAGDVTITVADDKCAAGITVTNTKVPVPPIVPPINPDKCENPTISVTPSTGEKPKAGTTVIVTVDGKTTVGKVDENGKVTFEGTPPTLEPGKKVTVKVDGYKETTTTISEKDCTTTIIITPNDKCENPTISVITPTGDKPEKGTKVTVTVDGKTTTGTVDENGKVTFEGTPPTLEPGKKVTVKVDGYKETTSEMNEKDCDTTIVITPNDKCENPTISVTPSTGDKPEKGTKVTVTTEDGKTTTGTVNEDGTITFEPGKEPTLEPGKKVTVEVEGYEPTTTTVNDKECNTTVTITPKNACDKFEVTVEDSDGDTINTVRVTIDGKTVKTTNGTYTFEQAVAPGTTVTFEKNGYTTQTIIVGDDCQVTVTLVKKDDSEEPGTDPEDPDNGGDGEDPNDGNTPDEEYPDGEYPDEEYPDADGDDNDNNDGNTGNNGNNGNDGNTGNNGNTGNDGNTGNNGNAGNNNNNAGNGNNNAPGNGNNNAPGNGNNNAANGSTGNHANTTGSSLLPQTGEQVALYSLVGMLLIGAAFMLFRRNRRKA